MANVAVLQVSDLGCFLVYTHFPDDSIYLHRFKQRLCIDVSAFTSPTQTGPALLSDVCLSTCLRDIFAWMFNKLHVPKIEPLISTASLKKNQTQLNQHKLALPVISPFWGNGNTILPEVWARRLEFIVNASISLKPHLQSFHKTFQVYLQDNIHHRTTSQHLHWYNSGLSCQRLPAGSAATSALPGSPRVLSTQHSSRGITLLLKTLKPSHLTWSKNQSPTMAWPPPTLSDHLSHTLPPAHRAPATLASLSCFE